MKKKTNKPLLIIGWICLAAVGFTIFFSGDKESEAGGAASEPSTAMKPERRSYEEIQDLKQIPHSYTIGCSSKEYLSQVSKAVSNKDNNALNHLLQTECIALNVGQSITVLDQGYIVSHIRAYLDAGGVDLYVYKDLLANK